MVLRIFNKMNARNTMEAEKRDLWDKEEERGHK